MFWRTEDGVEVDFIIDQQVGIEVKASKKVTDADIKSLRILKNECHALKTPLVHDYYLVSNDPFERKKEGIHLIHWQTFVSRLWSGKIIK